MARKITRATLDELEKEMAPLIRSKSNKPASEEQAMMREILGGGA